MHFSLQNPELTKIFSFFHADDLIVDPRNLEWMREANCPIVSKPFFYSMF